VSPRVTIESGASFRGQIDMQSESVKKAFARWEAGPSETQRSAEGSRGSSVSATPPPRPRSAAKSSPPGSATPKAATADG
jgi:hypothetical protein